MIINMIGGYGDVIFGEPIYRYLLERDGEKPIVIVHDHHVFFKDYIDSANFVPASQYPQLRDDANMKHGYIPIRWANQIFRGYGLHDHHDYSNVMLDKYRLLGLKEDLWKTLNVKLVNPDGNVSIFGTQTLGTSMSPPIKCILINEHSQAGSIKINVSRFQGSTVVSMSTDGAINLIDWAYRIYQADENHHVSTSTFYLMQAIKNKFPDWNAPCYIYPRPNEDGLLGISQLHPDFNLIRVEG